MSLEQILDILFGGQFDASKIASIIVGIYAIVMSIVEYKAKKKLITANLQEDRTQTKLNEAQEEIKELKEAVSYLSDIIVTSFLSSNTLNEGIKKQIAASSDKIQNLSGIKLSEVPVRMINAVNEYQQKNLNDKKEELMEATIEANNEIDDASETTQSAMDKIKLS